jgi:hypothetical protein
MTVIPSVFGTGSRAAPGRPRNFRCCAFQHHHCRRELGYSRSNRVAAGHSGSCNIGGYTATLTLRRSVRNPRGRHRPTRSGSPRALRGSMSWRTLTTVVVSLGDAVRHGWEFDIGTGQSYCDPKGFRARAYPVNVEPGSSVVKGPYVAETLAVYASGAPNAAASPALSALVLNVSTSRRSRDRTNSAQICRLQSRDRNHAQTQWLPCRQLCPSSQ